MLRIFSHKNRPPHLGPHPVESLLRHDGLPEGYAALETRPLRIGDSVNPTSVSNTLRRFFAYYAEVRDSAVNDQRASIPDDPAERARHLKSLCHFLDAAVVGTCALEVDEILEATLTSDLGLEKAWDDVGNLHLRPDALWAKDAEADNVVVSPREALAGQGSAIVILLEYGREPRRNGPGAQWTQGSQHQRTALRVAELAVLTATYLRRLGFTARAHLETCTDVNLQKLMVKSGVAEMTGTARPLRSPYLGRHFACAVVTTALEIAPDRPLAPRGIMGSLAAFGPSWWLGVGGTTPGLRAITGWNRPLHKGTYPMERIKKSTQPTTYVNAPAIKRVPKRADFFTRAMYGDIGEKPYRESLNGRFMHKEPIGSAMGKVLSNFVPLQYGEPVATQAPGTDDPKGNSDSIKALGYYLGADIMGITPAYDHIWYSHQFDGTPLIPYHKNAIVLVVDQNQETMSGSSGDDWISNSQSFRSYLRSGLLAGLMAEHIRRLGWSARAHTAWEEDILHIPALLHAGIGELSRIGETVLNPFLGPRFKDAIVTTDMPLEKDPYVDFGLQDFCSKCRKCARECPVQAIPYGPKVLFNGYEIWKPDVQKCASYRITNSGGAVCGRCMATCPFQSEGIMSNRVVLWASVHLPFLRQRIAKWDDKRGNGNMNPKKKWWWDLEDVNGKIAPAKRVNAKELRLDRKITAESQKLAIFPPEVAPAPDSTVAVPIDREAGIVAQKMAEKALFDLKSVEPSPHSTIR